MKDPLWCKKSRPTWFAKAGRTQGLIDGKTNDANFKHCGREQNCFSNSSLLSSGAAATECSRLGKVPGEDRNALCNAFVMMRTIETQKTGYRSIGEHVSAPTEELGPRILEESGILQQLIAGRLTHNPQLAGVQVWLWILSTLQANALCGKTWVDFR